MKGFKRFCVLFFGLIWIFNGYAWSNDAPHVFVPSFSNHTAAGGHHSMAVDENGQLWAWGGNGSGRLGNSDAGFKVSVPVPVNTPNGEGQLSDIISVDAGFSHSIALQKNGKVLAWGNNNSGQIGNISVDSESYLPVYVNGTDPETDLTEIIEVAAGKQHSVALRSDGTVWAWGENEFGQLGNNTLSDQKKPVQVVSPSGSGCLTNVVAISAGGFHTLALINDGTVWAWGSNSDGQLGLDKSVEFQKVPTQTSQLSQITCISAGYTHNIVRKSNGTVWAWGSNTDGQLGYFTGNAFSSSPQQVKAVDGIGDLMNIVDVAAGFSHSMALKDDGTLVTWGSNLNGRLGNGTETSSTLPSFVRSSDGVDILRNVIEIGAGDAHSLALLKNGQLMSWGLNNDGQLGDMSGTTRLFPIFVHGENQEDKLQLGQQYKVLHINEDQPSVPVLLILRDINGGQLTISATSSDESIFNPQNFEFNKQSQPFSLTVPSEESVSVTFTFNSEQNIHGSANITIITEDQLGARDIVRLQVVVSPVNDYPLISYIDSIQIDEDSISELIPFTVQDIDGDAIKVSALSYDTKLIPTSGLKIFGDASSRNIQIKPAPNAHGSTLVSLTVSDPSGLSNQSNFYVNVKSINDIPEMTIWPGIVQITSGYYHNIAIKNDWTVWAWGSNNSGQLGDHTSEPRNLPVQVKGPDGMGWLTDIVAVAAGSQHSLALSGNGQVLAWGDNSYGQLGNGSFDDSFIPVYVLNNMGEPFENVVAITSGANHSLLLTEDNQLWAWGKNDKGQLGNNSQTNQNRPVLVTNLYSENSIIQIAAGDSHSMFLLNNGNVLTWGDNSSGQLGIGSIVSSLIPVRVLKADSSDPLENIVSISAGAFHTLALNNEGHIWSFGLNAKGQLGNGGPIYTTSPMKVQHPDNRTVLSNIGQIAAGTDHSFAIQNNGTLWSWGKNDGGQLGYGSKSGNYYPAQVNTSSDTSLSQVLAIDSGKAHSVVLTKKGEVWAWGNNYSFQLGIGTSIECLVPIKVLSSDGSEPFVPGIIPLEYDTSDGVPSRPIQVTLYDLETPADNIVLTALSLGTQILPQENISIQGSGLNRQIILTPLVNKTGKLSVEVSVSDGTDVKKQQLTLGVNKFSIKPVISEIPDQFIVEDQALDDLKFTINDPDTPISELSIKVTSGNIALIPNHPDAITLTGENNEKTLQMLPLPNKSGQTLVVISVSDGINDVKTSFMLTVQPVNDPPKISDIKDQEIGAGLFSTSIGFTVIDLESEATNLTTWAVSSNAEIVPNDAIHMQITGTGTHKTIGITPIRDSSGELIITIFASDGVSTTSTNFILRVQGNKISPQISNIDNQTIKEDSSITVLFSLTDTDSGADQLTLSVYSSNSYVVPNLPENLQLKGSGINRTLTLIPEKDEFGTTNITITAEDPDHLFAQISFVLTVENINDEPTITEIDDQTIKENTSTPALLFTIHDAETEANDLSFTITSNNKLLVPEDNTHLHVTGQGENKALTVTPVKDTVGTSTIRIQISDGEFTSWESFFLTVEPENYPPEISNIFDQSTNVNDPLKVNFSISDREIGAHLLAVSVKSSDDSIIPNDTEHIELSGVHGEKSLTITPLTGESGQLTITIFVQDDRSTTSRSFLLTVNHPPEISNIDNHITDEDQKTGTIPFFIHDVETNPELLEVVAVSNNTDLIPNKDANIILGGSDSNRNISILPATNQFGTATIDVSVFDGYSKAHTFFDITVKPVNDRPFMSDIDRVTTHEDITPSPIAIAIGDVETTADLLTVSVSSNNPVLIPSSNIYITTQSASRYLTLTPTANNYGDAMIKLVLADPQGLTESQNFMFQVLSVNDAPLPVDQIHTTRVNVPIFDTLFAEDVDGDKLTYAIAAKPTKGSVTLINLETGEFVYQPDPENWGYDQFSFVAYDGFSISGEGTVTIDIQDVFPPEITLVGLNPDFIMLGQLFVEKGWSAYDNADGDLTDKVEKFGIVNTELLGKYHILYRVKDLNGNVGQIIREVVVIENAGNFEGTVQEIPFNLIPEPEKDIKIQLLDSISQKVLRETGIIMDGAIARFTFKNIPFQSYIVRAIISDPSEPPAYVSKYIDQHFLFQSNNQQIRVNIPELTLLANSYALEVELGGTYRPYDKYKYLIIDYKTGKTVKEGENDRSSFTEYLDEGNYRLLILAKAYAPFEYEDNWHNKLISLNQNVSLTEADSIKLTDDPDFNPNDAHIDVSHTLEDSGIGDDKDGFYLWFVRRDFNSDDHFKITILTSSGEVPIDEKIWGGDDMFDNQPYVYTWTTSSDLYYKIEEDKPHVDDKTYTVMFYFYRGSERIQSYSVKYVLRSENSTVIANEKQIFQDFVNETVCYETQSQKTFFPLAGAILNISFKDNMGNVIHKAISIPPIPLDYLVVEDQHTEIQSSDQLIATIRYYTFNGNVISNGVSIDFSTTDDKKVLYNPKHNRDPNAPFITVPLYLNKKSTFFNSLQQTRLSQAKDLMHIMVYDDSESEQNRNFQNEDLSFIVQDDGLVLVNINHLSMITLEANKAWNTFKNGDLNDGRCFINTTKSNKYIPWYLALILLGFFVCRRFDFLYKGVK